MPMTGLTPEILELARGPVGAPPTRDIAHITDDTIAGVPVRIYRPDGTPTGVVVYFHGGAFCLGSIGLMDNVAREIAHATGATVVSVEYRLAPENPYPAGVEDCDAVTRHVLAHAADFGADPRCVAVAGESAGGTLSAVTALRLRGAVDPPLAAQVLIYPAVIGFNERTPSRDAFDGIVINTAEGAVGEMYTGGRDLSDDPSVVPLNAKSHADLPPALVLVGGCDPLRDEGRMYAERLAADGVKVEEECYAGQPHGFVNFMLPAAADVFDRIGTFVRAVFAADQAS
jgi:acetyl esterase